MESSRPTPEGPEMPGFGIARDVRQLKTHGAASAAELQEFLDQMRGRSPQEVLGMVAASRLMRSVAVATIGAAVILVAGTVIPWLMGGPPAGAKARPEAAKTAAAPAEPKPAQETPARAPDQPVAPIAAPATAPKPSPADAEKAVKVMGLGDTKIADPKTNPLEKSLDNLLDKVE